MVLVRDRRAEQREDAVAGATARRSRRSDAPRRSSASSAGSIIARASSGSRSCISSVEPLMSANSAVTVLRSPSRFSAADESATRIGESFDFFDDAAAGAPNGAPQSSQNFAVGRFRRRTSRSDWRMECRTRRRIFCRRCFQSRISSSASGVPTFPMAEYRHCPQLINRAGNRKYQLCREIEAFVLIMLTEVFDPAGATLHSMSGCKLVGRARGETL